VDAPYLVDTEKTQFYRSLKEDHLLHYASKLSV